MRRRNPCTYILASQKRGTLYVGVTSDLPARIGQHRSAECPGFTSRYRVYRLVHAEFFETMDGAISREKQLKRWHRAWKINLIEANNPDWADLAVTWGLAEPLLHGP
ncbi:putative endonuclease [Sphingobium sp. B2D3A]|uniref:GIY-YIG nuclease family protein n=1 Tax=Sphingobium TaxID=165695 RepID=UPI00181B3494|nr:MULTISPECIES: GIY-YIG nuclease family protein [Sphingobium]MCW2336657.1 putative endonuclease [Sphingobium sp. B2D3A]MCW2349098.1 putative endonuclease [Sphingobium sp. B12D2B]MCW2363197.1 putative endonuclease [Sphingobium sp. B10D3B]MCW2383024.1 putative endonuclease [Sphingobium sp. B2D3B]MCW2386411.1 putative endonuclease [Sphingobium sp. B2D3D]